jgi:hypothetical protein
MGKGANTIQAFFNWGNVSSAIVEDKFQNISRSMTAYMRQHGSGSTPDYALGQVYQSDSVHVRWGWLAFPVVLLVFTPVFFIGMVAQTRTQDAIISGCKDYNSTTLPVFFSWIGSRDDGELGAEKREMVEMQRVAKLLHIILEPTDRGWKFVETGGDNAGSATVIA